MPRSANMPASKPVAGKRQVLTLAQLSAYDDILTDALVDHVGVSHDDGLTTLALKLICAGILLDDNP